MKKFLCLLAALNLAPVYAQDFNFAYLEFINLLEDGAFEQLKANISDNTMVGFGPNEEGYDAFLRVFSENDPCHKQLVTTLKLGCALTDDKTGCIAPPSAANDQVIGISTTAKFTFSNGKLLANYLICAGD